MNRLYQLRETLPANLNTLANRSNVELVLLNYNSSDGLHEWLTSKYCKVHLSPSLVYARQLSVTEYHASKAKNLAHRIATGSVLVNLDADNYIGNSIDFIENIFLSKSADIVHFWTGEFGDGTHGRIAVTRHAFDMLGGYDESLFPAGYQDCDLLARGKALGFRIRIAKPSLPTALWNSKEETIMNCKSSMTYEAMNYANTQKSIENIKRGKLRANLNGQADATFEIVSLGV